MRSSTHWREARPASVRAPDSSIRPRARSEASDAAHSSSVQARLAANALGMSPAATWVTMASQPE